MQASENYRNKGGILNRQKTNKQQQQNPSIKFFKLCIWTLLGRDICVAVHNISFWGQHRCSHCGDWLFSYLATSAGVAW